MPESHGALGVTVPQESDYSPGGPDVPRAIKEYHDSLESKALTAAEGRLLIAQPGDVARFKAMSGDVSINKDGITQIGSGKIFEGNLADGAATSRKTKPTTGLVKATGALTAGVAATLVPGAKLEITPAVASVLLVQAVFDIEVIGSTIASGDIYVDGALTEDGQGAVLSAGRATVAAVSRFSLSAAKHTIELRASVSTGIGGANAVVAANRTRFTYELFAA